MEEAREAERAPGHERKAVDHRAQLHHLEAGLLGGHREAVRRPIEDAARVEGLQLRGGAGEPAARLEHSRHLAEQLARALDVLEDLLAVDELEALLVEGELLAVEGHEL